MKALFGFAVALMITSVSHAWIPNLQFFVNQQYAQVQITNPTPAMAYCEGYTFGMTQTGVTVNAWFSAWVPPFGFQYAYVYTNYPFYFVNAWANINCTH